MSDRRGKAVRTLLMLAASLGAMLAGCGGGGDGGTIPVTFSVIDSGYSAIRTQQFVAVRNSAEWTSFWSSHKPPVPVPSVDFSEKMVVGVILGDRPSSCYSVAITQIVMSAQAVSVQYRENMPAPTDNCIAALGSPAQLATIPATTLPVQFSAN